MSQFSGTRSHPHGAVLLGVAGGMAVVAAGFFTGYLVLAYTGPPETTNCGSTDFHDWHLEILDEPLDHPPQPGDPTPIICEITPRTQNAIYRDGIRIQELAAFFRHPDVTYESTGHKAQKIRLTGYLLWDDEHNDSTKDVGVTIRSIARNRYHNPWRATAWATRT